MARTTNTFEKGMVKDLSDLIVSSDAYVHSQNGRLIYNDSGTYTWENDKGTTNEFTLNINHACPTTNSSVVDKKVVGHCEFSDYLVLFISFKIQGESNFSEIGRVKEVNDVLVYETMFCDKRDPHYALYDSENYLLNFSTACPIEAIAVTENIQHERVYFTDDCQPPRSFDIRKALDDSRKDYTGSVYGTDHGDFFSFINFNNCDTTPYKEEFRHNSHMMDIQPDCNFGFLRLHEQISGGLLSGQYQYSYRYVSDQGVRSDFYPLTPGVSVVDRPKSSGEDDMSQYYMDEVGVSSGKGNMLCIEGVDDRWTAIEFAYAYSQASMGPPLETNIVGQVLTDAELNDSLSITFGIEGSQAGNQIKRIYFKHTGNGGEPIEQEDLIKKYLIVNKAKTIATKGNRLWLGNIEEEQEIKIPDSVIQNITVTPKYHNFTADERGAPMHPPFMHHDLTNESMPQTLWNGTTVFLPIKDDFRNYKGAQMNMMRQGYWRGEVYRFGVVFFTKKGQALPVQHIADVTMPEQYETAVKFRTINENGTLNPEQTSASSQNATLTLHANNGVTRSQMDDLYQLSALGIEISGLDVSSFRDKISGYIIVRAKRDPKIIAQSVMAQAVRGQYGMSKYKLGGNKGEIGEDQFRTLVEDADSVMPPPTSNLMFRRLDTFFNHSIHGKDFTDSGNGYKTDKGGEMYHNPDHDDMWMFQTRGMCRRNADASGTENGGNPAGFRDCYRSRAAGVGGIFQAILGNDIIGPGDPGHTLGPNLQANDRNEMIEGFTGAPPPTTWLGGGNWTYAGNWTQMRLWSGRGSQQNSDLSDPKRRGAQNDEARIAIQHFYNESKDFNFRQNNLNRFPAPLVHNGGSTKAAFFPIQAKQHWYYMACPDYMMTNNSPLNVFPFLTQQVLDEDDEFTGEYDGTDTIAPAGGTKVKLVGKIQGAYKNYHITKKNNNQIIQTFSTNFHQEQPYAEIVKDYHVGGAGDNNAHRYVMPKFYTKHYRSFKLDHDNSRHAAWYKAGYYGVHAKKESGSSQPAIDLLAAHNLSTTEGEDYAGRKSSVWSNFDIGGGSAIFGSLQDGFGNDSENSTDAAVGVHPFRNIINNKHSLGLTSSVDAMIEAGAQQSKASYSRETTLRFIPGNIDSNFIDGNGVIQNYGRFSWVARESIVIQTVNCSNNGSLGTLMGSDVTAKPVNPGHVGKASGAMHSLKPHGNGTQSKEMASLLYRPMWGNYGDALQNWTNTAFHHLDNFRTEESNPPGTNISDDKNHAIVGGVGHKSSIFVRLKDFRYAFAGSNEGVNIGTTETGDHSDVWWVANVTDDNKVPYGGLNSISIQQYPFQSTGSFIPVSDWWNTPNIINDSTVFGGDCMVCLFDLSRFKPHHIGNLSHRNYTVANGQADSFENYGECDNDVINGFLDWETGGIIGKSGSDEKVHDDGYGLGMIFPIESNLNLDLSSGVDRFSNIGHQGLYDGWAQIESQYKNRGLFWHYDCAGENPANDYKNQQFQIADVLQHQEQFFFYTIAQEVLLEEELPYDFPTRWIWSEFKNYGESIDAFRKFPVAQYFDLDGAYGEVWGSAMLYNEIWSVQEDAFGKLRIDERAVVADAEGSANIIIGNPNVMQGVDYVSTESGTQNQFSITNSDMVLYWVDAKRAKICRYAGQGVEFISDTKGNHQYVKDISKFYFESNDDYKDIMDNPTGGTGVHAGFDFDSGDVVFTFLKDHRKVNSQGLNQTVIFNEKLDAFTTTMNITPRGYYRFGKRLLTQSPNSDNEVHSMFTNENRGQMFGTFEDSILEFVVNEAANTTKIFDNILINMNDFVSLLGQILFTSDLGGSQSVTPTSDVRSKYREAIFKSPVRQIGANDRVRGKSMRVKMTINNNGTQANVASVDTIFRVSNRG